MILDKLGGGDLRSIGRSNEVLGDALVEPELLQALYFHQEIINETHAG